MKRYWQFLKTWLDKNFTLKSVLLAAFALLAAIPDWQSRGEYWKGHAHAITQFFLFSGLGRLSVVISAALVIWADHRSVLKRHNVHKTQGEASPNIPARRVQSGDWISLADRFKRVAEEPHIFASDIRAEFTHQVGTPDETDVAHIQGPGKAETESLCKIAGAMLVQSPAVHGSLNPQVKAHGQPLQWWLFFVKNDKGVHKRVANGEVVQSGIKTSYVHETIQNLPHVSYLACLECAALETSGPSQSPRSPANIVPNDRPKIAIGFEPSGKPALGAPVTLRNVSYQNVGSASAHTIRLVPDKSKKFWVEQTQSIDMLPSNSPPCFPVLRAMTIDGGAERMLTSPDDPIRYLIGAMKLGGLQPELVFAITYTGFEGETAQYGDKWRARLSAGNPSFERIGDFDGVF